ncbi:uncharacterized protein LOC112693657 isoform X2 [Sipha flava]|uniref:Uncharacterized protein LOC112693657 isoform X2 n=1 Tax=Sipha flava TaxID=143950 RepID=A0A2S2R3J7_9HEMI|nr:uncharacterized protein LOC112693657 isoform X2 [Sipha flava]
MQTPTVITAVCLLMPVLVLQFRLISGHTIIDQHEGIEGNEAEPRALKSESVLMGIANSLIGGKTKGTTGGGQSLSLNMSNIVLMLVLRGLIWGVSYIQGSGKEARSEDLQTSAADMINETDMMLFLGYLVADESGQHDCLNLVACQQPTRAESYLRSAEMVWKTAKMLDGVVPLDTKYEQMLIELQEAIDNGKAGGDCQVRYKCYGPNNVDRFNLT